MTVDREIVAYHAAGRTLMLLENFNDVANGSVDPSVEIMHDPVMGSGYWIKCRVHVAKEDAEQLLQYRPGLLKDVALFIAGDAGESVAVGLSAERKAEALQRTEAVVRLKMGAVSQELVEKTAREAFDFAVATLENRKAVFDNLALAFKSCDLLADKAQIMEAARTGLPPSKPPKI